MKSKKSLCSKLLIKQDLKRFMPAMIAYLILLQLMVTLPTFTDLYAGVYDLDGLCYCMINSLNTLSSSVLAMIVGLFFALLLFGYLNKEKEAYNLHALPITRTTMFMSHYISGVIFLVVPVVITCIFLAILNAVFFVGVPTIILVTLVETIIENLFFFTLSCTVMMLSGNNTMAIIVYAVLNAAFPAFSVLLKEIRSIYTYALSNTRFLFGDELEDWAPVFYLNRYVTKSLYTNEDAVNTDLFSILFDWYNFYHVLLYLIPTVLLFAIAIYLYQKRHIEEVGEFMVFGFAKSVFRVVFTLYGSMLVIIVLYGSALRPIAARYTYTQQFPIVLVLCVIGCFIAYILANMILLKSVHVLKKTSYVACLALTVCMIAILLISRPHTFELDDIEIDGAYVNVNNWEEDSDERPYYAVIGDKAKVKDPEAASKLLALAKQLQETGQNRPVNFSLDERHIGYVNINLHKKGDAAYVNSISMGYDLDDADYRTVMELMKQIGTATYTEDMPFYY